MVAAREIEKRPIRVAKPTGASFDAKEASDQAKQFCPKVMARLAD